MNSFAVVPRYTRAASFSLRAWLHGYRLGLLLVLAAMTVIFLVPVLSLLALSFRDPTGNLSLAIYEDMFSRSSSFIVLWNTIRLSLESTLLTMAIAYPLAYVLARVKGSIGLLVMIPIVIIPYFTSGLVRTYAWMVLLGRTGVVNTLLQNLGITDAPAKILYTEIGTLIGLLYYFLPLMVLILYAVMRGIDRSLLGAAAVAGAGPFTVFRRVFFPLTLPGVFSAVMLTFIDALGSYVTPSLMGGSGQTMWAQSITSTIDMYGSWNYAAGLGVVLVALTIGSFIVADRVFHITSFFEQA
jgi:putative spermidine/putrescine transport system permease protein